MIEQTLTQLRQLKLSGFANALAQQMQQPTTYDALAFDERLHLLIEHETTERTHRKQQRLIRAARFKLAAQVQDIDYEHPRGLNRSTMASLLQGRWIDNAQNLLITGPCGSGKTYLACAIGHQACFQEYAVKYYRLSRLLLLLNQAKVDGTYMKTLTALSKTNCLILDDWGLEPLKPAQRNDLMEIFDDRHTHQATVVVSQLPLDQWYHCIGDNTLADAMLDRLLHNAHRINLKGESMRKKYASIDPT
jgi:DNA replication protein DnaC